MAEEIFFHYTSIKAANKIVHEGKILPSLAAHGDAIHGEGVYLTTLEPSLGEETIKNNNWDGRTATETNIEAYFEIQMPTNHVKRANDTRDIQVYEGSLKLSDYTWKLKNWHSDLLATQFFMVSSDGQSKVKQPESMGRYNLVNDIVMFKHVAEDEGRTFVYKNDAGTKYLYMNRFGKWCIGSIAGDISCNLRQKNDSARVYHSPPKTLPWQYYNVEDGGFVNDNTLKDSYLFFFFFFLSIIIFHNK